MSNHGLTINRTGRYVGRCKHCRTAIAKQTNNTFGRFMTDGCPTCGRIVKLSHVLGATSPKECDARCMNAVGPSCDCSCGGANHGAGHVR
jgi:hypothetical protein